MVFALVLAAAAHVASANMVSHGACMYSLTTVCSSFEGDYYQGRTEDLRKFCESEGGKFFQSGCPRESAVGTCHMDEGSSTYYTMTAYTGVTRDYAESSCHLMGGRFE